MALPLEKGVSKLDFVCRPFTFVEVIHVKLAYKRIQVTVLEVGWQSLINKGVPIGNLEA